MSANHTSPSAAPVTVTHFGHTAIGIETQCHNVLIDPMMFSTIKSPSLARLSRPAIRFASPVDEIFISHAHTDHFHLPTLLLLNRNARFHLYGGDPRDARMAGKVDRLRQQLDQLGYTQHGIIHADQTVELGDIRVQAIAVQDSIDDLGQCAFLADFGFATIFDGVDMLFDPAIAERLSQLDVTLAFLPSGYSQQSSAGRNQMAPFDSYKFARIVRPRFVAACGGAISVHCEQEGRPRAIASYPTGAQDWLPALPAHGIAVATPPAPSIYRIEASPGTAPIVSQEVLRLDTLPNRDPVAALYFSGYDLTDIVEPFDWLAAAPPAILHQQRLLEPILASLESRMAHLSAQAAPAINRTRFGQLAPHCLSLLHAKAAHAAIARCAAVTPPLAASKTDWIDACFLRWTAILEEADLYSPPIQSALTTDHAWSQVRNHQSLLASTFPREPWIKDEVAPAFRISIEAADLDLGVRLRLSDAARLIKAGDTATLVYPSRRGVESVPLEPATQQLLELAAKRPLADAIAMSAQQRGERPETHTAALLATINHLLALSTFTLEVCAPGPGDALTSIGAAAATAAGEREVRHPAQ